MLKTRHKILRFPYCVHLRSRCPTGSVIQHAIEATGGPIEGAVLGIIKLAVQRENEQQIYVPHEIYQSDTASGARFACFETHASQF